MNEIGLAFDGFRSFLLTVDSGVRVVAGILVNFHKKYFFISASFTLVLKFDLMLSFEVSLQTVPLAEITVAILADEWLKNNLK